MTNIVKHDTGMSLADLGQTLARSGFFSDTREASQAIVKVLAGREMGFGPVASMTGIYIVKGRVSLSANIMAAAVKRSGRYDFRVRELSEKVASIEFFEVVANKRESLGTSTFTIEDAKRAGTQNLDRFPKNMLYARAMSNGVKWYCPDVTGGPAYTPDELGEVVNEDGEIIDARPMPVVAQPAPVQPKREPTLSEQIAEFKPTAEFAPVVRETYNVLVTKITETTGVSPYADPPLNISDAIARCREMIAQIEEK